MFINDIFKKKINENDSDSQKYMQPDRGATQPKTGTEKPIDPRPAQEPKNPRDPKEYMIKSEGEDSIDGRLAAQYSTPQAKAKTQAIDQAFASGQQSDFDRLGIMSPQKIERDYQAMRSKEPAQDAALMTNPALTPSARTQTFKTNPKGVPVRERKVDEAGPFSYGARKPRKGSVADLAAQKRKEQERNKQPAEPRDHMVGVARVVKEGEDLSQYSTERLKAYVKKVSGGGVPAFGSGAKLKRVQAELKRREQGVAEGSVQDKLYKRHQELRKKSGLPDPDYYKELKASYDLPDAERYAKHKEIKQKYKVTNEDRERYIEELQRAGYEIVTEKRMTCPECGGAAYADQMLAEKQDACYHKVKSRYKVWPSAYASGALVRCRKKGAKNWGNKK